MNAFYNLVFLLLLLAVHSAKASVVKFNRTFLGGNSYQYDSTVRNDGSLGANDRLRAA
jgi:hypothetical protein